MGKKRDKLFSIPKDGEKAGDQVGEGLERKEEGKNDGQRILCVNKVKADGMARTWERGEKYINFTEQSYN
ncbi:hypothetical protein [Neobacillus endophyticus]|uniref:hypothetical protein n=1 Tax=Neobacillus endophyticus TaxID=2738405 RepID=UPI001C2550A2|nr:hypothetical protein [Neobacillus endophyticus]